MFEIVPMHTSNGQFQIHAKFMGNFYLFFIFSKKPNILFLNIYSYFQGVRMEHVEIDIQDLLQLQYDGVSVMNMFGKAKINVNLMLHFLNTKFYGRPK